MPSRNPENFARSQPLSPGMKGRKCSWMFGSDWAGSVRKNAPARDAPMLSGPLRGQQVVLDPLDALREPRADFLVEGIGTRGLELCAVLHMVHEVLADPGQVVDDVDAEALQQSTRPDAADLQQLRRVQRAGGEDDRHARAEIRYSWPFLR